MELPLTTFLWPLVAKHGAHVPEPLRRDREIMLHHRPHTARCALRTQGHAVVIAIRKGVHLFFDNIGDFTNRAGKEVGRLDNGQAHFRVAVAGQYLEGGSLHRLPQRRLFGEDINHPAYGSVCRHALGISACWR